jgi:hypothetical protein
MTTRIPVAREPCETSEGFRRSGTEGISLRQSAPDLVLVVALRRLFVVISASLA